MVESVIRMTFKTREGEKQSHDIPSRNVMRQGVGQRIMTS